MLISLKTLYQEIRAISNSLDSREPLLPASQVESKTLKVQTETIRSRVLIQFQSLEAMTERFSREEIESRFRQWYHRISFMLMQEELMERITEKDHPMEDLRRVEDKSVQLLLAPLPLLVSSAVTHV